MDFKFPPVDESDVRPAGKPGECFYCQQPIGQEHGIACRQFPSMRMPRAEDERAWIQWKGTKVCMDVSCKCGEPFHIDAEFAYHIKCPKCGQVYECDGHIKLHPLDFESENGAVEAE